MKKNIMTLLALTVFASTCYAVPIFSTSNDTEKIDIEPTKTETVKKVWYDAKSNYNLLMNLGVKPKGLLYDVLLASYVKDPNRKHTLDAQGLDFLNHILSSTDDVSRYGLHENF